MRGIALYALLGGLIGATTAADAARLSAKKAEEICRHVLILVNSDKLKNSVWPFTKATEHERERWDLEKKANQHSRPWWMNGHLVDVLPTELHHDSQPGRIDLLQRILNDGTCYTTRIVDLETPVDVASTQYMGFSESEIGNDEGLRWADRGATDYFLEVGNEPVVVTGQLGAERSWISLVSWFREGQKRPLCTFEPTYKVVQDVVVSHDNKLCRAAMTPSSIAVQLTPSEDIAKMLRASGRVADTASTARIDLNLDGATDTIALGVHASGAGCGRDGISLLYPVADDMSHVLESDLQKVLAARMGAVAVRREIGRS